METELRMPIRAHPYDHQQRAFLFALQVLGVLQEEGNDRADEKKKEGDAHGSNQ